MENQKHCFALDLKNDAVLINEYITYHKKVWPEIIESIKGSHIEKLEIYLVENRLFMIMETNALFSFGKKQEADKNNAKVQEWENLMWKYQQAIPNSKPGEKWRLMNKIFEL
ncbi:L-rhamnose mutarotase [uncultured Maribacter sp.]|uniref:L-rhamnose mutarotase n=1 Tax=uncultured Maribacter sp. TaxID=431308 RepID=UPI0030ED588A|tara:strand:+ start:67234 stop:67569 length:336 start_codon:yes stop_codon:yes gene_type:complete